MGSDLSVYATDGTLATMHTPSHNNVRAYYHDPVNYLNDYWRRTGKRYYPRQVDIQVHLGCVSEITLVLTQGGKFNIPVTPEVYKWYMRDKKEWLIDYGETYGFNIVLSGADGLPSYWELYG